MQVVVDTSQESIEDLIGGALFKDGYFEAYKVLIWKTYDWLNKCPIKLTDDNYNSIKDTMQEDITNDFYKELAKNVKKELECGR